VIDIKSDREIFLIILFLNLRIIFPGLLNIVTVIVQKCVVLISADDDESGSAAPGSDVTSLPPQKKSKGTFSIVIT
jgi:hypothetical protein